MKGNEAKRHHYVPQFYQRGFADTDGRLWVYDRNAQKYRKIHPINICRENELYTIDPKDTKNRVIETKWMAKLDGEGATAIRMFQDKTQFDQEWKESFSIFMAQLITRSPAFRDSMLQQFQQVGQQFLRLGFSDVSRAKEQLERYREESGDKSIDNVTADSLVEAVVGGYIQTTARADAHLKYVLSHVESLARCMANMNWEIIQSPSDTGFILCDYPFVGVPAESRPDDIGFGFAGVFKYFPLTRFLCLRMSDLGYVFSYRTATKEQVRIINQNMAVNSQRFIMGPDKAQLMHVISRSKTQGSAPSPRIPVETVEQSRNDGLIRVEFWPRRRFFYSKT